MKVEKIYQMKEKEVGFWKEFKEFAVKGNVVDMAVGVVIGGAFGKIVSSLVNDLVMPIFGKLLGNTDFSGFFVALDRGDYATLSAAEEAGTPVIKYGVFINTVIEFLIISLVIFLVIRTTNKFKKEQAPTTKTCPYCKSSVPLEATRCPHCTSELE